MFLEHIDKVHCLLKFNQPRSIKNFLKILEITQISNLKLSIKNEANVLRIAEFICLLHAYSNKIFEIKSKVYRRKGIYNKFLIIEKSQMPLISKIDKIQIGKLLIRYSTNRHSLIFNLNKNGENINISIIGYGEHYYAEDKIIIIKIRDKNEFEKVALTIIEFIKKDNNDKFKFIVNQIMPVEIKLEFDM